MATVAVTKDNFESLVDQPGVVVLDFWAEWCGPCRMFAPVFEAAAVRHPAITWGKVDTEAERELAGGFGIRSIPTLMVFRDGILLFEQAGSLPGHVLDELVRKVGALDMAEVQRKIAADRQGQAAG